MTTPLREPLRVRQPDGSVSTAAFPSEMPDDVFPGEMVISQRVVGSPPEVAFVVEKERYWDGTKWRVAYTLDVFRGELTDAAKVRAARLAALRQFGWIE